VTRSLELDELVEHWTLLDDERELIAGKCGPDEVGLAVLLKFYTRLGRFPRGRSELPDQAMEFVAWQVRCSGKFLCYRWVWAGSLRSAAIYRWTTSVCNLRLERSRFRGRGAKMCF
jgi:hypothetical protein